jgi:hypothetical protein
MTENEKLEYGLFNQAPEGVEIPKGKAWLYDEPFFTTFTLKTAETCLERYSLPTDDFASLSTNLSQLIPGSTRVIKVRRIVTSCWLQQ